MKIKNEIKVGIIVIAGIALLIYGYYFLKGMDLFNLTHQREYYAVYENVGGLSESNPVILNGYSVGTVKEISLLPQKQNKLLVKFIITNKSLEIPANSVALITSGDIFGTRSIDLQIGNSVVMAQSGDTLKAEIAATLTEQVNEQILPLKVKTEELIGSVDSAVTIVQTLLNKEVRGNLAESFKSIKHALETFEKTSMRVDTMIASEKGKLERIFSNVEEISATIRNNSRELDAAIKNFSAISDTLAKADLAATIHNANNVLDDMAQVMEKINRGEGTAGQLIHNDTLYHNLVSTSAEMEKLVKELRENPHKFVHISLIDFHRENKKKDD